jgi:hypothetical protein
MVQYLHKYLVLNRKLSIPDIGNFTIEMKGAKMDNTNGLLFAPSPAIQFKQEQTPPADKFFFDFLAQEMGVDSVVAIKSFHDYLYKMKLMLGTAQGVVLPGLGVMRKEENGYILFTAERNLNEIMPSVKVTEEMHVAKKIEVVHHEDDERDLTNAEVEDIKELLGQDSQSSTSDNWWVYAIILFLMGIGALLFYYV